MEKNPDLPAEGILLAEYGYIAQTVFQNNEDRARVAQFYLVSFGSFIAGLVTTQLDPDPRYLSLINYGFGGLFLMLALLGALTVAQLAQLRSAWFESIKAMNKIKQYYFERHPEQSLADAFLWKDLLGVPKFKFKSVAFALFLQVAVVASIALGAAIYMLSSGSGVYDNYGLAIVGGIFYLALQFVIYRLMLE